MTIEQITKFLIDNPDITKEIANIRERILQNIPCALLKPRQ